MKTRVRAGAVITTGAVLLAGCAASHPTDAAPTRVAAPGHSMTSGMVMPDGSTMGAESATGSSNRSSTNDVPTAAEKMICGSEVRGDITKILGLGRPPAAAASWRSHRYTCRYTLPAGQLVVSVQRSPNPAAARTYFTALRRTLSDPHPLDGLGQGSYGTARGTVVLVKDSDTLMVDATRLPAVFGAQQSKRFDFSYELASDILGCWTGG